MLTNLSKLTVSLSLAQRALVGWAATLFEDKKSYGDLVGKALGENIFKDNPLLLEQGNFKFYRTGTGADRLFFPTVESDSFLNSAGFERDKLGEIGIPAALLDFEVKSSGEIDLFNQISADPNNLLGPLSNPALGAASVLGGGNQRAIAHLFNILRNNQVIGGLEFEQEARRQLRSTVEAGGFDLNTSIEVLAADFFNANQKYGEADINRDILVNSLTGVIELFNDDIPKGVDVMGIALEHIGERSVNTGVLLTQLNRQMEIFGDFASASERGLRNAIGIQFAERSPESIARGGGSIADIVNGVRRQGSGFVSSLATDISGAMSSAITEGLFDAIEDGPAWDALQTQLASSVQTGLGLEQLPGLIGAVYQEALPKIQGFQEAQEHLLSIAQTTPEALGNRADAVDEIIAGIRYGKLTPEQQLGQIDKELLGIDSDIAGILRDGVIDATEALTYSDLLGRKVELGQDRYGLRDELHTGGSLTALRRKEAFETETLGILGEAGSQLRNFEQRQLNAFTTGTLVVDDTLPYEVLPDGRRRGSSILTGGDEHFQQAQLDATTAGTEATAQQTHATFDLQESTDSLASEIRALRADIRSGVIAPDIAAKAIAKLLYDDPETANALDERAQHSR